MVKARPTGEHELGNAGQPAEPVIVLWMTYGRQTDRAVVWAICEAP